MTCRMGSSRRSAWASTSATASSSVSATATHLQEHDTARGAAMAVFPEVSLYARVPIRRSRATRRRSRRAANLPTARRAAQTTRSIIINRPGAHRVPATNSLVQLELS